MISEEDVLHSILPCAPPDGGYLVLTKRQISNFDLLCAIKSEYRTTRIIAQQPIPTGR